MTSSAAYVEGTTVILHPNEARRLRMFCFTPKSNATTCKGKDEQQYNMKWSRLNEERYNKKWNWMLCSSLLDRLCFTPKSNATTCKGKDEQQHNKKWSGIP